MSFQKGKPASHTRAGYKSIVVVNINPSYFLVARLMKTTEKWQKKYTMKNALVFFQKSFTSTVCLVCITILHLDSAQKGSKRIDPHQRVDSRQHVRPDRLSDITCHLSADHGRRRQCRS